MAYNTIEVSDTSDVIQADTSDALDWKLRSIHDIPVSTDNVEDGYPLTYLNDGSEEAAFAKPSDPVWYYKPLTGRYYDTSYLMALGSLGSQTVPDDVLVAIPFFAPYAISLDRIKCFPSVTDATSQVRLGLYDCDTNGYPANRLAQTPGINLTQYDTYYAVSYTLSRGAYWLVMIHNRVSITQFYSYSLLGGRGLLGIPDSTSAPNAFRSLVYAFTYTFGALPDPFPSSRLPDTASYMPSIAIRIA